MLRKQSVCQIQVKHRANIVSHNSAHLQRRWKHVRDSWDTWLPEWFVDSFVFCWWVVLCFIVDSLAFCLWWVSDVFMFHLCLLLCCVYVVLCWFFTSLVYVRLLASDLVRIDEALWVYLKNSAKTDFFLCPEWARHLKSGAKNWPRIRVVDKPIFFSWCGFKTTSQIIK